MQGKVKLTRRQIKEDKFATFMLTSKDRVAENWQYAAIGALALLLVVAGAIYYFSNRSSSSDEAATKMAQAVMEQRTGNRQLATVTLNQILSEFSGTPEADQATFMLGRINLDARNYPEAQRFFETYLRDFPSNRLNRSAALAGLGVILENQGQSAEAAAKYVEAAKESADGPLQPDYYVSAIRCFAEVGDKEQPLALLDTLEARFGGSPAIARATRIVAEKGLLKSGS